MDEVVNRLRHVKSSLVSVTLLLLLVVNIAWKVYEVFYRLIKRQLFFLFFFSYRKSRKNFWAFWVPSFYKDVFCRSLSFFGEINWIKQTNKNKKQHLAFQWRSCCISEPKSQNGETLIRFFIPFSVVSFRTVCIQIIRSSWDEWGLRITYNELSKVLTPALCFWFLLFYFWQYSALSYLHQKKEKSFQLLLNLMMEFLKGIRTLRVPPGTSLHLYLSWQYLNFWFLWIYHFKRHQRQLMSHWSKIWKRTSVSLRRNALTQIQVALTELLKPL